jgi:23S rRNA pseudouridine2457 synthase
VELLDPQPTVPERDPPIRFRASIPTTWIAITIREGKNRQVRRMTAAIGFPTLRLLRMRFGPYSLQQMKAGEVHEFEL